LETEEEIRRNREAKARRQTRLPEKKREKERRSSIDICPRP